MAKNNLFREGFQTLYDFCDEDCLEKEPLKEICENDKFVAKNDHPELDWIVLVTRFSDAYREIKGVSDILLNQKIGNESSDSDIELLRQAQRILILTDSGKDILGLETEPTYSLESIDTRVNPLYERLADYRSPRLFIEMKKFGNAMPKSVNKDGIICPMDNNDELKKHILWFADSLYAVVKEIKSSENASRYSCSNERRIDHLEQSIHAFLNAFPSYASRIHSLSLSEDDIIIDEFETPEMGKRRCLRKELECAITGLQGAKRDYKMATVKLKPWGDKKFIESQMPYIIPIFNLRDIGRSL